MLKRARTGLSIPAAALSPFVLLYLQVRTFEAEPVSELENGISLVIHRQSSCGEA